MKVAEFNCRKYDYKTIWKTILRGVMEMGDDVVVYDNKSKRSGGLTKDLSDLVVIFNDPYIPSEEEIDLIPPIGKKFLANMMITNPSIQYERIVGSGQIDDIIKRINKNKHTRRAIFTVFLPDDILSDYAICTIAGQFLVRNDKLSLRVFMRSNDAYNAFLGNVYGFVSLLHQVAKETNTEPAKYIHYATSMHIYEVDFDKVKKLINF